MKSKEAFTIFEKSINDYHINDHIDTAIKNPFEKKDIRHLFYHKNWVDTVQWHLEDIIRDPEIDAVEALEIKRRIDKSNQVRTDMVEFIDSYFLNTVFSVWKPPNNINGILGSFCRFLRRIYYALVI